MVVGSLWNSVVARMNITYVGGSSSVLRSALKADEDVFLCGMTLGELADKLGTKTTPLGDDGYEFVRAVIGAE